MRRSRKSFEKLKKGSPGRRRSVKTAAGNAARLRLEIDDQCREVARWAEKAKGDLLSGLEEKARQDLMRKREVEDLIAGLEQQHAAAEATRDHLTTTLHALEARLADARRRQQELNEPAASQGTGAVHSIDPVPYCVADRVDRDREIDEELAALKRELNG